MNELLRRIRSLSAVPVTTEIAPTLGAHIDVTADAPTPVTGHWTVPLVEPPLPTMPSPRNTGTCYHSLHAHYFGERIGLLIQEGGRATWLPCEFSNADGQ